jgi:hypothetical protein
MYNIENISFFTKDLFLIIFILDIQIILPKNGMSILHVSKFNKTVIYVISLSLFFFKIFIMGHYF